MFETIVIRRNGNDGNPINSGLLAETLLFYDNVHVIADAGTLLALATQIGGDNLISLLSSHHIKVTCIIGLHCTFTRNENGIPINSFFTCVEFGRKTKTKLTNHEHF